MSARPVVAIVGRPNVGKSSLFNRLLRRSRSIVADEPGVTRDRIYGDVSLRGETIDREVVLVDTGGFDPTSADPIMRRVLEQTQLAIDEADVVVHLVDARAGVLPEDRDIASLLRRANKRTILAVNKIDGPKQDDLIHDFYGLAAEATVPVSAAHGRYTIELEEMIVQRLPEVEEAPPERAELTLGGGEETEAGEGEEGADAVSPADLPPLRIAVIGRPNSGKSSLVNRLLGEDRHLVSEVAGTTVDSVDSLVEWRNEKFLFIDTAGIRRKRSIAHRVEKFSVVAALKGLERSDVALLLIDATQPIAAQDAKVSAFAYERGKAVVLVVSKWDLLQHESAKKDFAKKVRDDLPHLAYAPIVFTSSHSGMGIDELMPTIKRVHDEYSTRVPTGQLNRFVEDLMEKTPPPSKRLKRGRIYYITQIAVRPPRFLVSVNTPELIHFSYRRFLVNELRKRYGFSGSPLLIGYRSHKGEKGAKRAKRKDEVEAPEGVEATPNVPGRIEIKPRTGLAPRGARDRRDRERADRDRVRERDRDRDRDRDDRGVPAPAKTEAPRPTRTWKAEAKPPAPAKGGKAAMQRAQAVAKNAQAAGGGSKPGAPGKKAGGPPTRTKLGKLRWPSVGSASVVGGSKPEKGSKGGKPSKSKTPRT